MADSPTVITPQSPELDAEPELLEEQSEAKPRRHRRTKAEMAAAAASGPATVAAQTKPGGGWSEEDLFQVQVLATGVLLLLTKGVSRWAVKSDDLVPAEDELARFTEPLARILSRHVKIPHAKRGDVADVIAMLAAVTAYAIRVTDERAQRLKHEKQQLDRMASSWPQPAAAA